MAPVHAPTQASSRISPSRQSVKINGGFTYDTVETVNQSASKLAPVTTKRWSAKTKDMGGYKASTSPMKAKSPIRPRKSFTKSPSDSRKNIAPYNTSAK